MKVTLFSNTAPQLTHFSLEESNDFGLYLLCVAGRRCTFGGNNDELMDDVSSWTLEKQISFISMMIKKEHLSVLEHFSFSFLVENVSRNLLAQITRHRIGISFSVMSQRYVKEKNIADNVIVPEKIKNNSKASNAFMEGLESIQKTYDKMVDSGILQEDARSIYPGAMSTNFVITFNLRSFLDFYKKRTLEKGAQDEIRKLGSLMMDEIKIIFPNIYKAIENGLDLN